MPPEVDFMFDVFLRHSGKDKAVVRPLAERLRAAGLRQNYFGLRISAAGGLGGAGA